MGETLRRRVGFLPVWAWALLLVVVLALFLSYRKQKAAQAAAQQNAQNQNNVSSNLGTVPVSNLTTVAQPMPIQMGDTFVNTSVPETVNVSPSTTVNNQPPAMTMQPAPPPAPPPPPVVPNTQPKQPGYGLVNTIQGLMVWLGVNTAGNQVYNVGGGAPVFFGNASSLSQGLPSGTGQDIYTPVGYQNQVASSPELLRSAY